MNITYCKDYQDMSAQAASLVISEVEQNPGLLLCTPTGNSPSGLYDELVARSILDSTLFTRLRIIKLDEWGGIPMDHPSSCEHYLKTRLLDPLGIPPGNYLSFLSDPADPRAECGRIESELHRRGPIDLCILGLGKNGHLGLNEPGDFLEPGSHVAALSEETLQHSMISSTGTRPRYGLTLGMQQILGARKILLLVSGREKEKVTGQLLRKQISSSLPASLLWLHSQVECFFDRPA